MMEFYIVKKNDSVFYKAAQPALPLERFTIWDEINLKLGTLEKMMNLYHAHILAKKKSSREQQSSFHSYFILLKPGSIRQVLFRFNIPTLKSHSCNHFSPYYTLIYIFNYYRVKLFMWLAQSTIQAFGVSQCSHHKRTS